MIGRLHGILIDKQLDQVLLDVGGVGYEVEIPQSTYDVLGMSGETVTLVTHMVVRDDAHLLYGFASERERELFRSLIKVNKVGPKLAIAILSGLSVAELVAAIRDEEPKVINAISGVGKVTAERVVMELRNKLPQWESDLPVVQKTAGSDVLVDAEAALIELGYRPQDAARALAQLQPPLDLAQAIRQALKVLS